MGMKQNNNKAGKYFTRKTKCLEQKCRLFGSNSAIDKKKFMINHEKLSTNTIPKVDFGDLFDLSNIWIWVKFKNIPVDADRENFEEAIKAYYIVGILGGYNSLNLQMFFTEEIKHNYPYDETKKLPNPMPAYLHELGKIEYSGAWGRFKIDMGTTDELAFDILINILIGFSLNLTQLENIVIGGDNYIWRKPLKPSRKEQMWNKL